jgi:hypothetical protein
MLQGFFDESAYGDVFLVGGWVSDSETWERFTADWQSALDADPKIRYFKHHEAKGEPPSGEFEGLTRDQAEAKISRLVDVICHHKMYGVYSDLDIKTHNEAFADSVIPLKQLRTFFKPIHYYHSCLYSANAMVLQIEVDKGNTSDPVDFIFDQQEGLFDECRKLYEEFKGKFPPDKRAIAGRLTEARDTDIAALQAADLLVGQITANLRLGYPEPHAIRMWEAHEVFSSKAYLPRFQQLPDFVRAFNVVWSSIKLGRIAKERGRQEGSAESKK